MWFQQPDAFRLVRVRVRVISCASSIRFRSGPFQNIHFFLLKPFFCWFRCVLHHCHAERFQLHLSHLQLSSRHQKVPCQNRLVLGVYQVYQYTSCFKPDFLYPLYFPAQSSLYSLHSMREKTRSDFLKVCSSPQAKITWLHTTPLTDTGL